MRPSLRTLAAVVAILGLSGPSSAADADLATRDPGEAYRATLESLGGEPIALPAALARAFDTSPALGAARAQLAAAEGAARRERGAFDPTLFAEAHVAEADTPASSPFAGADVLATREEGGSAGARMTLPIGTEIEARLESSRLTTNSEFAAYSPEYSANGTVTLRQPLLQGFGIGTRGPLSRSENAVAAARAQFEDARLALEVDVTAAYWDLYAAERDLAVQRLLVERSAVFLNEATRKAEAGLVGPSEVATARVFSTEQRLAELDQEERLDVLSDRLGVLIGQSPADARWHPVSDPGSLEDVDSEDALVARALETNEALRAARANLDALRADASAARRNLLPSLDVIGTLGGNGLAGTGREISFGGDVTVVPDRGDRGESVDQVLQRDYPTWSVGLELELPLFLREGRGEADRASAEVKRAEDQVAELERDIRADVRARAREARNGSERLSLAREGLDASLEQVRIGQIEYANGRTTAFELVRLAADLASAQERHSSALVRTAKAAAELRRLAPPPTASTQGERE
ncbi:MAG: TolC family protein [bacterium]